MKKTMIMGIALLSLALVSCGNDDECSSCQIDGTYTMTRTITMETPPSIPFAPITQVVSVDIMSQDENFLGVELPAASYDFNGQEMNMPAFTIDGIPVVDDLDGGVVIPNHDFKVKAGNKDVIGNIKGELEEDGDIELDVRFKFGAMPFYMVQEYERVFN